MLKLTKPATRRDLLFLLASSGLRIPRHRSPIPRQAGDGFRGRTFILDYRYNANGNVSELGYPDNTWEALSPNALGQPTAMGQFASNVSWHRSGPLAGFTYGNNVVFSQQLNLRGLPSERSDRLGTQARQHNTYSWDGNGNLSADNDLVGDVSQYRNASRWLQYDGLDRLTIADSAAQPPLQRSSPWSFSWSEGRFGYDALDNLRTFKMGYLDLRYQHIGHRLSTIQQGTDPTPLFGYGHNTRGQVTSRQFGGDSFTLSWDSAHRLTRSQNTVSVRPSHLPL